MEKVNLKEILPVGTRALISHIHDHFEVDEVLVIEWSASGCLKVNYMIEGEVLWLSSRAVENIVVLDILPSICEDGDRSFNCSVDRYLEPIED